ncbi:Glucan endo-1,3-beta-glucosidase 1 [Glycine max]|nr:Glucan endo-1,3-beta-glucosidase 1 [Glycine max]
MASMSHLVNFLMHQKITHIGLYDPNPDILRALSGTHIHVTISVPNNQLLAIASSNTTATSWIRRNVAAYHPSTRIAAVSLGDEVLSTLPSVAPLLLLALCSLHAALVYSNLHNDVFVSTPHSASVILNPFPPSQGFFNQTLETFILPLLHFLSQTNSPLMLNLYPYYVFMQNRNLVPLENTLFKWCHIIRKLVWKDFNIAYEAGGVGKEIKIPFPAYVNNNSLEIRFYWAGKGTNAIPYKSIYGPLISAISVTRELKDLNMQTSLFTNNFDISNKIGEGGFGPVYKGILSNGTIIAVKMLSSRSKQGNREFINEIGLISALEHPCLIKLYGCCVEGDQLLLVYEYMENNSLAQALFGK